MQNIEPTSSFGRLFVDERHGYIGIGKSDKYNPKKCQWFKITDIENPGLYVVKPRADTKRRVAVDCEFICDVPSQGLHIKEIVRKRIFCTHHKYALNPQYEEWEEPGAISIMRGVINQAYHNAYNNEMQQMSEHLRSVRACTANLAHMVFMLPDDFTLEQLEDRYQRLYEAFQGTDCLNFIIASYNILLEEKA